LLQHNDIHGHSSLLKPTFPRAGRFWANIRPTEGHYKVLGY